VPRADKAYSKACKKKHVDINVTWECGTTNGCTTYYAGNLWGPWINELTTTRQAITMTAWPQWVAQTSATTQQTIQIPQPTQEQLAEMQRRANEHAAQRAAAAAKADVLLSEHLTAAQRAELAVHRDEYGGYFTVRGSAGGEYRIYASGGVKRVENGFVVEGLCCHPDGYPNGDRMLTQKVWLEADEPEFRRIANKTRLVPVPSAAPERQAA
jgi:hypothetical protein